jgi:hypothetical protein
VRLTSQPGARLLSVYRIAVKENVHNVLFSFLPVNNPALFFATIFWEAVYFLASYIRSVAL